MADQQNDYDNQDERMPDIRSLRQAAEAGKAAQQEAAELRRQLMFARAGIDFESNKLGSLLYKTWEGDNVDDLINEAADLGLIQTYADDHQDMYAEQADFRRNLAAGAPSGAYEPESRDPRDEAMEQFHEDRRRGVTRENAALAAFDRIFTAAAAGDQRVIFDPNNWSPEYR